MGWTQLKIIKENCDPNVDNNRDLPNSCFIVTYKVEDKEQHDLVVAAKQTEIFDTYYDKYKKDFIFMKQSEGRANPKLWGNPAPKERKKRS